MPPVSIKKPQETLSPAFVSSRVEALQSKSPGAILSAAGDLLRRSQRAGREVVEQAELALQRLPVGEVISAVEAIDVVSCRRSIEHAGAQAFEAAFADTQEERGVFARAAVDALSARDCVESTLFASKRRMTMEAAQEAASLRLAIEEKVARVRDLDALFGGSVGRSLTGINDERRSSLRELDPTEHEHCPWLTRFGSADDVLPVLGGTKTSDMSEPASSALRAAQLPAFTERTSSSGKRTEALVAAEASALGRIALGNASSAERSFVETRARRRVEGGDDSLALALRELEAPIDAGES